MAIAARLLKPQATRAGMTLEEYAASKNVAKCDICGLWGTKDSEMFHVGDVLAPQTWRCKTHTPDTRSTTTEATH
jgi:hypothetical protein